jgi:WD40 repeat protein
MLKFESGMGMGQVGDIEFVDDRVLSVVGTSGQLLLIDVEAGHEMRHLATHILTQGVLDVSPDGKALCVGSGDGSIKLLDTQPLLKPTVLWHDTDVRHVAFMNNGSRLLTADSRGAITSWNIDDGVHQSVVESDDAVSRVYATQHTGPLIAVASGGSSISIIDAESGSVVAQPEYSEAGAITTLQFSSDDRQLAVGSREGALIGFSTSDWTSPAFEISDVGNGVNDVAFSSDGGVVAVAFLDASVQFFSARTGDQLAWKIDVESEPLVLAYCEGGNVIAIGTSTGELQLWEVATRSRRSTIKAHTSRINVLSVFPDGQTLASGGRDRRLQLWDTRSGERLTTLRGHSRQFFSIAISPDGKTVASGGLAGDVRVWRSEP